MMDRDKRLTGHKRGQSVSSLPIIFMHAFLSFCARQMCLLQKASIQVVFGTQKKLETHNCLLASLPEHVHIPSLCITVVLPCYELQATSSCRLLLQPLPYLNSRPL